MSSRKKVVRGLVYYSYSAQRSESGAENSAPCLSVGVLCFDVFQDNPQLVKSRKRMECGMVRESERRKMNLIRLWHELPLLVSSIRRANINPNSWTRQLEIRLVHPLHFVLLVHVLRNFRGQRTNQHHLLYSSTIVFIIFGFGIWFIAWCRLSTCLSGNERSGLRNERTVPDRSRNGHIIYFICMDGKWEILKSLSPMWCE
jgi:hypothetical protein